MDVRDVTSRTDPQKTRHSDRNKPYIDAENHTFNIVILRYNLLILHKTDAVIRSMMYFL
jgi:hypothetical protein